MNRLKELRELHEWSQKEAAHKLGIVYTTYRGYEDGSRGINSETLVKLSQFYNVSIEYLLCRSESPAPEAQNKLENELLFYFHQLNEAGKTLAVNHLRTLSESPATSEKNNTDTSTVSA